MKFEIPPALKAEHEEHVLYPAAILLGAHLERTLAKKGLRVA